LTALLLDRIFTPLSTGHWEAGRRWARGELPLREPNDGKQLDTCERSKGIRGQVIDQKAPRRRRRYGTTQPRRHFIEDFTRPSWEFGQAKSHQQSP
jgi:hypothetical protein